MEKQNRRWAVSGAENRGAYARTARVVVGVIDRRKCQRPLRVLAGLGAAMMMTLGCGTNPDADFVETANQICGDGNAQLAKVQDALSRGEGGLTASRQRSFVLKDFIPGVERQLEAIWGLEMTAETRAGVARMQLAAQAALQELKRQPDLLFDASEDQSLFAGVDQAAQALGLNQCRADPVS